MRPHHLENATIGVDSWVDLDSVMMITSVVINLTTASFTFRIAGSDPITISTLVGTNANAAMNNLHDTMLSEWLGDLANQT